MGRLRFLAALNLVAAVLASRGARAQSTWTSRAALTLDARGELGTGDVGGLTLGVLGAGIEWRVAPTLRLRTVGLLLGPTGSTDAGQTANGGAGGELAARLVPFPTWPLRPYLRTSAGLLFFLNGPLLPGGDVYDFMIAVGAGFEVPLGDRWSVMVDAHVLHLSNGQGLGPFNPAFNGRGGLIAVDYALAPTDGSTGPWDGIATGEGARDGWTPGAVIDADAGSAEGALVLAGRLRLAERLARQYLGQLDVESGEIGSGLFEDLGLDLVGHWGFASGGVHGGYRRAGGTETVVAQAQVEAHLTPETSLVLLADAQDPTGSAKLLQAGIGARFFPVPSFVIEVGGALSRIESSPVRQGLKPYFGFEWQIPLPMRDGSLSVFLEKQIAPLQIVGLRFAWDMGSTPRDLARRTGWRRVR